MGNNFVRIFREEVEREENERGARLSEFALLKLMYRSLSLLLALNLLVLVIELLEILNSDDDDADGHSEDHVALVEKKESPTGEKRQYGFFGF